MKTLEQQNAMIAEFMGLHEIVKTSGAAFQDNNTNEIHLLKYHTSWDWLMPVIEKIEKLNYDFEILGGCWVIIKDVDPDRDESTEIIEVSSKTKMQTVYNAVCQFIEWYNANK